MPRPAFAFAVGLASLAALAPAEAGPCQVYPFRLVFAADSATTMNAASGKDCPIVARSEEKFAIDSNEITIPPSHGGAKTKGKSGAYYRSNPGFRGGDVFAFTLCGSDKGKPGCSTVRVKVHVR
jgi:hypothetical protein